MNGTSPDAGQHRFRVFGTVGSPHALNSPDAGQHRFRLFGTVGSPYALKLRSILRYQRLPFDWVPASLDWIPQGLNREPASLKARAEIADIRPPVIPVVYFPSDRTYRNDSTAIAMALDRYAKDRPIQPPDPGWALLSHLIEDMADEWGVKIAFQYRWGHDADSTVKSRIVTGELLGGGFSETVQRDTATHFAARQIGRMRLVGCTPENAPLIEATFRRILKVTGAILASGTFLFGDHPTLADFGWYGQLESLATDPTSRALMQEIAPATFTYLQILEDASGVEAPWPKSCERPPQPVVDLLRLAGEVYLPFLEANARACAERAESFSLSALGLPYSQRPFKYQAKCLNWLRDEFATLPPDARERVAPVLSDTGCLEFLN
jgi:glutathione S-transferase